MWSVSRREIRCPAVALAIGQVGLSAWSVAASHLRGRACTDKTEEECNRHGDGGKVPENMKNRNKQESSKDVNERVLGNNDDLEIWKEGRPQWAMGLQRCWPVAVDPWKAAGD